MGNPYSKFLTQDQLDGYERESFFTKSEVLTVLKQFDERTRHKFGDPTDRILNVEEFKNTPELRRNPFKDRMAAVFSNDHGEIGFAEYLDFKSVFSEEAARDVKIYYAFKIYDFDDDGYLSEADVTEVVRRLVGKNLSSGEIRTIVKKIMQEADLSGGSSLSFVEFEHILSRSPNFENTFRISLA